MLDRILAIMKEKGINKNQLAKITKIPRTTIYSALANEESICNANLETIRPIAKALDTTLDYIISGEKATNKFIPNTIIAVGDNGQQTIYQVNEEDIDFVITLLSKLSKGQQK